MLIIPKCLRLEKCVGDANLSTSATDRIVSNIVITNKYLIATDKRTIVLVRLQVKCGLNTVMPIKIYREARQWCNKINKKESNMYFTLEKDKWLVYSSLADFEKKEGCFIYEQPEHSHSNYENVVKQIFNEFMPQVKDYKVHRMRTHVPIVQLRTLFEALGVKRESNTFAVENINWYNGRTVDGEPSHSYGPVLFLRGMDDERDYEIFAVLMCTKGREGNLTEYFEEELLEKERAFTKENYYDKAK